jgi:hypothetical protein
MANYQALENEYISMMTTCAHEIKSLRRTVADLQPRAEAYDRLSAVIDMFPRRSVGMGEDLAWRLDKRVEELRTKREKETAASKENDNG